MNMINQKEIELKKLWQASLIASGDMKTNLLVAFWNEYRKYRKNKEFIAEVKNSDNNTTEREAYK